ncbi:MAG: carboxypeptidase-like regulatory domain-containing protein [Saprospiraceae bacterium]
MTLFQAICCLGQIENQSFIDLKAVVVEEGSDQVLAYANVFNQQRLIGTATNLEGYFELPNNKIGDTIIVSYLGYEDEIFVISNDVILIIKLTPSSGTLEEVVVTAESGYLYDMVAKLRKKKRTKSREAKTYFYLETLLFDEPIEIIESYYNGKYSNYGLSELEMKKGRIGLKPVKNRYFSSTESSRIFSLHDFFSKNKFFPDNPLALKKKELKKAYSLELSHTYLDQEQKIYVIDFFPKKENSEWFGGRIWMDRDRNKILKVKLEIQNSKIHPFVPIGHNTIQYVDMEMTKSFEEINNSPFINSIDYNYNVVYRDSSGNELKATTRAYLNAYDYNATFNLPNFEFTRHLHEDYRNITAAGYDAVFWNGTTEFRFYDRMYEVENFIKENYIDNNLLFPKRKSANKQQLEFPYIMWNENRFEMTQVSDEKIEYSKRTRAFESDRYHLNVKLYCDINYIQDSMIYRLATILDPVGSYYHFKIMDIDRAFMNMYLDLMEIQKRKFETELSKMQHPSIELVNKLYEKQINEFKVNSKLFVAETNKGRNWDKMEWWNKFILKALNIDNLKMLNLSSSN